MIASMPASKRARQNPRERAMINRPTQLRATLVSFQCITAVSFPRRYVAIVDPQGVPDHSFVLLRRNHSLGQEPLETAEVMDRVTVLTDKPDPSTGNQPAGPIFSQSVEFWLINAQVPGSASLSLSGSNDSTFPRRGLLSSISSARAAARSRDDFLPVHLL